MFDQQNALQVILRHNISVSLLRAIEHETHVFIALNMPNMQITIKNK